MTVSYMLQRGLPLLKNMYCDIWADTAKLQPPKLGQSVVSLTVYEEDGSKSLVLWSLRQEEPMFKLYLGYRESSRSARAS